MWQCVHGIPLKLRYIDGIARHMYQLYKHPPLAGINRQLLACGGLHDPGPLAVQTVNYTTVFSSDNYCLSELVWHTSLICSVQ